MEKPRLKRITAAIGFAAMLVGQLEAMPLAYAENGEHSRDRARRLTETPIEHLIVVIPENRSYDHTFVHHRRNAYVPANMPAIGDLFDMFDFDHDEHRSDQPAAPAHAA